MRRTIRSIIVIFLVLSLWSCAKTKETEQIVFENMNYIKAPVRFGSEMEYTVEDKDFCSRLLNALNTGESIFDD